MRGIGGAIVRRDPGPVAEDAESVPQWVLEGGFITAAMLRLKADPSLWTASGHAGLHAEASRNRKAAEQWCTERGLSYCMTVLGWAHPDPAEQAAGRVTGAGPRYERKQAWLREHRR